MRTPREIYKAYKIMPNLQLHQLRVAAVGKMICDNFREPVEKNDVVLACLFHDMGNIVKFDLGRFPEFLEPEGRAYWEEVKRDVEKKYGSEQHVASEAIARELGLSEAVLRMIRSSGFRDMPKIIESDDRAWKILKYADLRVAPKGIVSLAERFEDFAVRYRGNITDVETLEKGRLLETQIFAHADIRPEDVTDESVAPFMEELWEYPVP
jgi:hypothetical protein